MAAEDNDFLIDFLDKQFDGELTEEVEVGAVEVQLAEIKATKSDGSSHLDVGPVEFQVLGTKSDDSSHLIETPVECQVIGNSIVSV
jgi:hypothetical protein